MTPFVSGPISLADESVGKGYLRADLVLDGVDHSGPSYQLRVFFNNPTATVATEPVEANGYVDSIYIFGHGGCFGDEGHCDLPRHRRSSDRRPPHHLAPAKMWITVTEAVRAYAQRGQDLVITIVPVFTTQPAGGHPIVFERVSLLTYG